MEPSGRSQWQQVANAKALEPLKQAKTVATGCDQLPPNLDGKEGVDGSSPSEGLALLSQIWASDRGHPTRARRRAVAGETVRRITQFFFPLGRS
jgi:hypothetical protein